MILSLFIYFFSFSVQINGWNGKIMCISETALIK